eukprot:CAMPEP_0173410242 /NCGR_PEP_ID=MMETSP1356-20130122/74163_1 /TAXON_ID=77927 ORGANISM="Hemiselmis virescens, Strain PCC157" /NCGR_SAMPLE_ID=MMETSP1356 /ASSEMBLY_ACC=CAM_ASM_000847 /LENGTH=55 /DNA_ID=CAMNT_0014371851 /DNA_START=69 /DNA_END=232 /DNA_ORIENTATION=+
MKVTLSVSFAQLFCMSISSSRDNLSLQVSSLSTSSSIHPWYVSTCSSRYGTSSTP